MGSSCAKKVSFLKMPKFIFLQLFRHDVFVNLKVEKEIKVFVKFQIKRANKIFCKIFIHKNILYWTFLGIFPHVYGYADVGTSFFYYSSSSLQSPP